MKRKEEKGGVNVEGLRMLHEAKVHFGKRSETSFQKNEGSLNASFKTTGEISSNKSFELGRGVDKVGGIQATYPR